MESILSGICIRIPDVFWLVFFFFFKYVYPHHFAFKLSVFLEFTISLRDYLNCKSPGF